MHWHYLSLGSNLAPQQHLAQALYTLSRSFGAVLLLPVVQTAPVHMHSTNSFLNTLAVVPSSRSALELKGFFNQLEEQAGRDRSDPQRGMKDRALDIDMIASTTELSLLPFQGCPEPYCQASLNALWPQKSSIPKCVPLTLPSSPTCYLSGQQAATIYAHHGGRHILVTEDAIDSLLQSFKTAFNR